LYDRFAKELLQEGVVVRPNGLWYVSAAHTEKDVEETLSIVKRTLGRIIQ
jgi:glutamate-1-semialdehyde 2,1-aminomutase